MRLTIEASLRRVADLLREGESLNTQLSYRSALRYWAAWYGIRYGAQIGLPLPAACVLQFIVDHAQRTTPKGLVHELPVEIDAALVEAIAGHIRAQQLADELGLADWSAAHDSRAFTLHRADYLTLAGNWLAFWTHETLAIPVQIGIDEIALALTADAHARTYRSQVLSIATASLVTRSGLRLIPDRAHSEPSMRSLSITNGPASHALQQALENIASRHGPATARLVALQLEYPSPYLAPVSPP